MRQVRVWILLCTCLVAIGLCGFTGFNAGVAGVDAALEEQVLQIIRNHPEAIIESVQVYQQEQQEATRQAQAAFSQQMQANPAAVIGNAPTAGSSQQSIVLLEFADFQCPYCAKAHDRVKELLTQYPDITFVYKHFPLVSIHDQAQPSAQAAWAAQQQGQFWAYYDALYDHQEELGESLYRQLADELGLDLDQFEKDRNSEEAVVAIANDITQATSIRLSGTPFFMLNGQVLSPALSPEEVETALAQVR
ncbi:MAG: DsbA family protein [Cyanobacteria bacterium P01_D01_bin.156]